MNDIERAIDDLKDINIILKTQHMCKVLDDELTKKDVEDYRNRFASVNLAISALEKQLNGGWIPVKKKLPDTNKDILVTLNDGKVVPARYLFADNLNHITAWQPLPPAYKEV